LIRSVKGNLFAQVGFESRQLRDEVDVTDIHTDRRTYALTATLAGDRRDASGISNINAALTAGQLDFQNGTAKAADSSTAKTRGGYAKLNVSLARLQGLTQSNSLYVAFNGQIADKNLDPSEQFLSADRLASGPTTWVPSAGLWVRWRLWNCVTTSALLCPGCGRRLRSWTVAWFEFTKISSKQERTLRLFRAPAWA